MIDLPPAIKPIHELLNIDTKIKIVDVGANAIDGAPPYKPLMDRGHAEVIGFEPGAIAYLTLQKNKTACETYLPHAVGDGKTHTLHLCRGSGMTSLLEPNMELLSRYYMFEILAQSVGTDEIATHRLDDIPETEGLDLLKIDIQGAELMVFENAPNRLDNALVVHTEVNFLPFYKNMPLYSEVELCLRKHGFILHRFEPIVMRTQKPVAPFASPNQMMWADAIFIRDFMRPDLLSNEQLLKIAIILHELYASYDLALQYLIQYDARMGTQLCHTYLLAIRNAEDQLCFEQQKKWLNLLS